MAAWGFVKIKWVSMCPLRHPRIQRGLVGSRVILSHLSLIESSCLQNWGGGVSGQASGPPNDWRTRPQPLRKAGSWPRDISSAVRHVQTSLPAPGQPLDGAGGKPVPAGADPQGWKLGDSGESPRRVRGLLPSGCGEFLRLRDRMGADGEDQSGVQVALLGKLAEVGKC